MTQPRLVLVLAVMLAWCAAAPVQGGDWPQWRGPHFNGSAASDELGLPAKFSRTQNVIWAAPMPGPSAATPIVVGDRVFVSTFVPASSTVEALCLDRHTGELVWQRRLGVGVESRSPGGEVHSAEPSPASDGNRVVFMTGLGEVVAFTLEGEELWRTNVQESYGSFNIQFGYSSSPLLFDDKVYVQVLQRDVAIRRAHDEIRDSYLLALDAATGQKIFRAVRPDEARLESKEAYSTPIPRVVDDRAEIVLLGGDCITGHDAQTGEELWRYGDWNPQRIHHWRIVPSPVVGGGYVYAFAPKGEPIFAVAVEGMRTRTAWSMTEKTTDVATPLFYRDDLFVLKGEGRDKWLTRVNPANGEARWSSPVPSREVLRVSPTAGDGKIYVMNAEGEVFVYAADDGRPLHHVNMAGYPARSTIAIAHGRLFIRTADKLYCIGE